MRFRSRTAKLLVLIALTPMILALGSLLVYFLGGCEHGLKEPAECTAIPESNGQAAYVTLLLGAYPSVIWAMLSGVFSAYCEWRTRSAAFAKGAKS